MDFVQKVKLFNEIAGQYEEFSPRKVALYSGLIAEEFAEIIASYNDPSLQGFHDVLVKYGDAFKAGLFDSSAENVDRVEFLDGAVDVAVVAIGAGISVGADIEGATHHIADNNLSKYDIVGGEFVVLRDPNGKIMKPESYVRPNLIPFVK